MCQGDEGTEITCIFPIQGTEACIQSIFCSIVTCMVSFLEPPVPRAFLGLQTHLAANSHAPGAPVIELHTVLLLEASPSRLCADRFSHPDPPLTPRSPSGFTPAPALSLRWTPAGGIHILLKVPRRGGMPSIAYNSGLILTSSRILFPTSFTPASWGHPLNKLPTSKCSFPDSALTETQTKA